ncbi:expressed unknown protein [Seminavis robusta]|uniref:Uncharacterized protein n=1 Tax=Seminavis robusta TaxID=568900 RepID=A0A9N8DDE9_9STRA|nr:expressed unknown protein [Seminavis robusta]|eukprot:Sro68_g038020.1 n/a (195) ;mRNA; f:43148-43732
MGLFSKIRRRLRQYRFDGEEDLQMEPPAEITIYRNRGTWLEGEFIMMGQGGFGLPSIVSRQDNHFDTPTVAIMDNRDKSYTAQAHEQSPLIAPARVIRLSRDDYMPHETSSTHLTKAVEAVTAAILMLCVVTTFAGLNATGCAVIVAVSLSNQPITDSVLASVLLLTMGTVGTRCVRWTARHDILLETRGGNCA